MTTTATDRGRCTTSTLELTLLGTYEVTLDNRPLFDIGGRKAQALLCYLAVIAKPIARDTLVALLWPEMAEKAAKNNLRTTLASLKRQIGPYLDASTTSVAFNRRLPYLLDVETLHERLAAALSAQNLVQLQAATELYQGEFLQGFHVRKAEPFEEWLLQQREQLHLQMLRALEILTASCLTQGAYTIGLSASRRLLAMEPWSEIAHCQMMRLLAASGQRAQALQQYETCRQVLAAELGIDPMSETTALYQQIQSGTYDATLPHSEQGLPPDLLPSLLPIALSSRKPPAIPHNLTAPLAAFVGRQTELDFIWQRLDAADCRLLTVMGPGGVGKTALAQELGQRLLDADSAYFPDGIFFVPLAAIESAGHHTDDRADSALPIITTIAEYIGCQFQGGQPPQHQLQAYLQTRRLLLILDNFEQLVGYADIIVALLTNAPDVTMLITSRVRLNVRGETILMLNGLSLPAARDPATFHKDSTWQGGEAVALFIERAQCLDPSFTIRPETMISIVQICQMVAGLPLALEMIAAWINYYDCAEIVEKLKRGHQEHELLISPYLDHPKRHQDLQTVFDDSWILLAEDAQGALAQLSIFARQFTRQAALAIADITLLTLKQLRDHSLLQVDSGGIYSLHPLIKQFAAQKWQQLTAHQPQQRHLLRQAHSHYYLQGVADLAQALRGEKEVEAIRILQKNHVEIVRGWQWATQQKDRILIQRAMIGLFRYLELTNQTTEGRALFGMGTAPQSDPTAAWLLVAHCHFLRRLAEHDKARTCLEKLLATMSPLLDESAASSVAIPSVEPAPKKASQTIHKDAAMPIVTQAFALCVLGWVYYEQGNYEAARNCFSTAHVQAEIIAEHTCIMQALNGLGSVFFSTKNYEVAHKYYQAALSLAQQQSDLHYTAVVLGNLAAQAQATNAYGEADRYLQMRLEIDQQTQNVRQMAVSYQRLGQLALLREAYAKAEAYFRESLVHFEQLGNSPEVVHMLLDLSKSLLRQNQLQQAEVECLRSLQLALHAQMTPRILSALTLLAEIRIVEEKKDEAATLLQMVNRNAQIPAMAHKTAKKLQADLVKELGEDTIMGINQAMAGKSLQEFSRHLLM